ncbi:ABC transporter permease [Rhodosalinus sp. FB01]|uniref:ABC transporter permease n=1 Tax=Rhodosalinus sp. FB01 TaxID=3239194 RepID=UPI003525219D
MTHRATSASLPERKFRFFRSVAALILREMESSYGRSPGGYLWALIEPVAAIALMSVVFELIFRAPSLGSNFPLFFATGFMPFLLYMTVSQTTSTAIRYSRPLLEYPAVTFLDALVARVALNTLTNLVVSALVLWGIVLIYRLNPILDWSAIFLSMAMGVSLAFGVGTMNCYLISQFQIWERVWAVLNRPLFLVSAVLFIPEDVPTQYRDILMLNPVASVVTEMRKGFYATYEAVHVRPLYVFSVAGVLATLGLFLLIRNHKQIMER